MVKKKSPKPLSFSKRPAYRAAFILLALLLSAAVFAGAGAAAQNVTTAEQLNAAFSDSSVSEIILDNDITMTGEITVTKNVTLDLAGHTLTAASGKRLFTVKGGSAFTLTDSNPAAAHYYTYVDGGAWTNKGDSYTGTSVSLAEFSLADAKKAPAGTYVVKICGGVLSGGSADWHGGGAVYVSENAAFTMNGCTIAGCSAAEG